MDDRKHPPRLQKIDSGRIFAWTPELEGRSDMIPIWDDDAPPEGYEQPKAAGLHINSPKDAEMETKKLIRQQEDIIAKMEKQLSLMSQENSTLNEKIERLESQLRSDFTPETDEGLEFNPDEPNVSNEPEEKINPEIRESHLVATCIDLIRQNDPNNFTGNGFPRVSVLEKLADVGEITAEDRDFAYEEAQKLLE